MIYGNELPSARDILLKELETANWRQIDTPQKVLHTVHNCMENVRIQMVSACWGNKARTDACNTLFREAQAGVALAIDSIAAVRAEQLEDISFPMQTEKSASSSKDYVQFVLLVAGAICIMLGGSFSLSIRKMIFGAMGSLFVIVALMREARRTLDIDTIRFLLKKVIRNKRMQKFADDIAVDHLNDSATDLSHKAVRTLKVRAFIDHDSIEAACIEQMEIIDANLLLFTDDSQKVDDDGRMWPLVRILLQEKYAADHTLPPTVEAEMNRYIRNNDLTLLEYTAENAGHFQTQQMDETFTIFPAVLDKNGRIVEYGVAGVKEDSYA